MTSPYPFKFLILYGRYGECVGKSQERLEKGVFKDDSAKFSINDGLWVNKFPYDLFFVGIHR